jgi:hypothetical protein
VIRDKTSDVTSITNLGADRLRFELDEDGLIHICDMLIGQYNDEEMAVLREYCTNARDAHIAAAIAAAERGEEWTPRPIEVTLPIDPYGLPSADKGRFLRIKDYGVGLSVEEIGSVFSRIGKSTKDDSNEQNGMMGIGGKSGLCATFGTFRITAVKDGEKAIVMCGRNEATEPVMDLVSITETDEPNGVEIELPTPKYHKLRRKAAALFQFWPEGSVLVDGVEPEKLKPKVKITDDMWIVDSLSSKGQRSDWIVMADVPYPVQLDGKLADDHSLVIFVPTGAVTIAPSREALRMTPKTKDELARLMAVYDQGRGCQGPRQGSHRLRHQGRPGSHLARSQDSVGVLRSVHQDQGRVGGRHPGDRAWEDPEGSPLSPEDDLPGYPDGRRARARVHRQELQLRRQGKA